ncbi:hypothetical protein [uncultured Desulfovibrio sp.]|uniref:Complement resistance protein TraT n=1 Tax=Candidatus Desulfovibrio intestinavium TaxID=2838534 RepID=A0A9D2KRK8_9BACT|nr:hypothetical protein [uncultured Desulfovibrio sp.]HJA78496.1 complement resistance protein TraT [Candidatus Desulfovibrio intestinavium]
MRNRLMRNHDILRLLLVLLLILCLCLPGCGSKLPDGGSLTSVAADEDSSLYLDVSGKDVDAGKLSAAIRQGIEHNSVMRPVDNPDEKTLVVKVEVRDMFQAGTVGFSPVGWLGSTVGGALAGLAFGALVGAYTETSALLGAGVGMVVGVVGGSSYALAQADREIWAVRAGVGMATGRTPDRLEEIVVSSGEDGVASREEAIPQIGRRLAERIREVISTGAGGAGGE